LPAAVRIARSSEKENKKEIRKWRTHDVRKTKANGSICSFWGGPVDDERAGQRSPPFRDALKAEEVAELKALFATDYRSIVLDLRDVRLADRDEMKFLRDCEAPEMKLENCPEYVREWVEREKG
jgi:hypothetical protein